MKPILMFYLPTCPYCRQAFGWLEELMDEKPEYRQIPFETVDEAAEAARAETYDYYYVPTLYVDAVKRHEGAATKEKLRQVLEEALNG